VHTRLENPITSYSSHQQFGGKLPRELIKHYGNYWCLPNYIKTAASSLSKISFPPNLYTIGWKSHSSKYFEAPTPCRGPRIKQKVWSDVLMHSQFLLAAGKSATPPNCHNPVIISIPHYIFYTHGSTACGTKKLLSDIPSIITWHILSAKSQILFQLSMFRHEKESIVTINFLEPSSAFNCCFSLPSGTKFTNL